MKEPGLFRVPGSTIVVSNMKVAIDKGAKVEFSQVGVADVASLFKSFFSELPEPLLTFSLYKEFLSALSKFSDLKVQLLTRFQSNTRH